MKILVLPISALLGIVSVRLIIENFGLAAYAQYGLLVAIGNLLPFAGKLAAGKTAEGTYVFTVPKNKRKPITLSVSVNDDPVLVFTGNAR